MQDNPSETRARSWSLIACAVLQILYLLTAARYVLGGDNAEFVTVAFDGGVAHPPGYPLFVLWLRAFSWLPAETEAHATALATAFSGGLALVLLSRATRSWGASETGAALAVAVFGTATLTARLATAAEVFMLNAALVAAILWIAAPLGPLGGSRRTILLAALAGLALSNHQSAVLVAPVGLWGAWIGWREDRKQVRTLAFAVAAFMLGLLPYAVIVHESRRSSPSALAWGDASTMVGLWKHFLRADYGTTSLGAQPASVSVIDNEAWLASNLLAQTRVLPVLIAAVGVYVVTCRRSVSRSGGVFLMASLLLAGPVFVARFNLPLRALGQVVVERFHLLPLLITSVLAGVGATPIIRRSRGATRYGPALAAIVLVGNAALSMPELAIDHAPTVQHYLEDSLAILPSRSILIGTGDHRVFGFAFVQRVLGRRRDVDYVDAHLMSYPWYRRSLNVRVGLGSDTAIVDPRVLAARAMSTSRPVFVTDLSLPEIAKSFVTFPFGTVLRVLSPESDAPSVAEVEAMNVELFSRLHASSPTRRDSWAQGVRSDYERTWLMIADAYTQSARPDAAARNRARAAYYQPE